jgi:hypothetical protein
VTTANQTKKQCPLLGNKFLISKYTQPLLSNAFENEYALTATNQHSTIEELFGTIFSRLTVPRSYKQDSWNNESVENIRGLNLAVVKLTTVQVTKLPL